jgi:hypothetical protein
MNVVSKNDFSSFLKVISKDISDYDIQDLFLFLCKRLTVDKLNTSQDFSASSA